MNNDARKRVKLIIRQVHPDLFVNNPYERQCNSESLKNLNAYVDELSKGRVPSPMQLEFYIREASVLKKLDCQLTASGSLSPLFFAFGLISVEELRASDSQSLANDTNLLGWLRDQVIEAVRTAEKHDVLKWHIRRLKSALEEKYQLAAVQVGAEYAVSLMEQERQAEALKALEQGLQTVAAEKGVAYCQGLTIQLYHPSSCPQETTSFMDEGNGSINMKTVYMRPFVADDGAVHLVADRDTIVAQLLSVDIVRARTLTQVSFFWLKRVRDLTPAVTDLLGVRSVWCDTKTEQNSQKFVIWAGYLLEKKEEITSMLGSRKFSFSVIVHTDQQAPLINFHQSSPILNVRADCPPSHLMEFLASEGGVLASSAAAEVHVSRQREEALLERVRATFEAKCVIKICMNDKVVEGAMRLLEHANTIRQAVNLKGACIALDDCYEVWDSGFISIPYNFKIQELTGMVRMLQSGQRPDQASANTLSIDSGSSTDREEALAVGGKSTMQAATSSKPSQAEASSAQAPISNTNEAGWSPFAGNASVHGNTTAIAGATLHGRQAVATAAGGGPVHRTHHQRRSRLPCRTKPMAALPPPIMQLSLQVLQRHPLHHQRSAAARATVGRI